jgi:parvulin-like peptidyl-prolyl isomerase
MDMSRITPPLRIRGFAFTIAALALVLLLSACGGDAKGPVKKSSQRSASVADLPQAPGGIVARVGPIAITQAAYQRWFAGDVSTEQEAFRVPPVPPYFTACIDNLRRASAAASESANAPSQAELKGKCRQQYEETKTRTLDTLITDEWVVSAAEELGLKLSRSLVEHKLEEFRLEQFPSEARYQAYLRETHQTNGDVLFKTRVELLGEAIRARIRARVGAFTPARTAAYYRAHISAYTEPKERDLHILRADTLAVALKARQEIASGKSFARVTASLHLKEPDYSKNGLVLGLKPHGYSQLPLNDAIFSARPGSLSHPVHTSLGWYVFEVTKLHASFVKPLSAVSRSIKADVLPKLQQQALASFITNWRKQWSSRTVCASGFIVRRCGQYKVTASTPPDNAYALG